MGQYNPIRYRELVETEYSCAHPTDSGLSMLSRTHSHFLTNHSSDSFSLFPAKPPVCLLGIPQWELIMFKHICCFIFTAVLSSDVHSSVCDTEALILYFSKAGAAHMCCHTCANNYPVISSIVQPSRCMSRYLRLLCWSGDIQWSLELIKCFPLNVLT